MAYEIENGIPMPEQEKKPRANKYPFDRMNIGDSFVVPCSIKNPKQIVVRARKLCKPKLFEVAKDPNSANGAWRVWRTA